MSSSLACNLHLVEVSLEYSTPNQTEQEVMEDRNCDGRMVLIKI